MEEICQIVLENEQMLKQICLVVIEKQSKECATYLLEKSGNIIQPSLYRQLLVIAEDQETLRNLTSFKSKDIMKCLLLAQKIKNNEIVQILINHKIGC